MTESERVSAESVDSPPQETSFVVDLFKLASGSLFAQVFVILIVPILTRIYTPEAFGVYAVYLSVVTVLGSVACLGYDRSIMLPAKDQEAVIQLVISLGFATITSGFSVLLVWVGAHSFAEWMHIPEMASYLRLAPFSILLNGAFVALSQWATRAKQFGYLSIAGVMNSVVATGAQLVAGIMGQATGLSIILASLIGSLVSTLFLFWQAWRDGARLLRDGLCWHDAREGIGRYRKFPLYASGATLINGASWQLPTFLLTTFFSPAIAGFYTLGNRVVRLPMNLIGNSIAQVFYQRSAVAYSEGTLASLVESVFSQLVLFGMFPMFVLMIIGRDLFIIVFGSEWAEAGLYTQILSLWTFFWFISSPLSTLFYIFEKQGTFLIINIAIFVTRLVALGVGGLLGNARLALTWFAVSGIIVYGYLCLVVVVDSKVPWRRIIDILGSSFLVSVPVCCVLGVASLLQIPRWIIVVIACAFLALYFLVVLCKNPWVRQLLQKSGFVRIG